MKISLSDNISKLRKEHSMTQEQLAEALGVTFASVSKWERGVATPELKLIAEMADLFGMSLDALVGFEVQNNSVGAWKERVQELKRAKRYEEAVVEAEKALLRYPNDFRIVYCSGELYAVAGFEGKQEKYLYRGMELLEYSILLLTQNTDLEISEVSIRNMIAQCYMELGKYEQGIEIFKKNNVDGVNNDVIAIIYAGNDNFAPQKAEPYMMDAFGNIITSSVRTMMAYANYYFRIKDYASGRESLLWLVHFLQSIKMNKKEVAYVDKIIAVSYVQCANFSAFLQEMEKCEEYLRYACQIAKKFDAEPTYRIENIKFCVGEVEKMVIYDDLGKSAMTAIEKQMAEEKNHEMLQGIWEKIILEETECATELRNHSYGKEV